MSKDNWFQHYERLYDEREAGEIDVDDEELSEMADEAQRDEMADRADILHDERKHDVG